MMAEPLKTLEMHYPMIQFLINKLENDHWIMQFKVFNGLAIMVCEPLYHALHLTAFFFYIVS